MEGECTRENIVCTLNVSDRVDWQRFTARETSQNRRWHGEIVDEWNTRRPGHWFVVRWDISDKSGPYKGPRADDMNPEYEPFAPNFFQEMCRELKHCSDTTGLHPKTNRLPPRPTGG
jgi:hypothetical protein